MSDPKKTAAAARELQFSLMTRLPGIPLPALSQLLDEAEKAPSVESFVRGMEPHLDTQAAVDHALTSPTGRSIVAEHQKVDHAKALEQLTAPVDRMIYARRHGLT